MSKHLCERASCLQSCMHHLDPQVVNLEGIQYKAFEAQIDLVLDAFELDGVVHYGELNAYCSRQNFVNAILHFYERVECTDESAA